MTKQEIENALQELRATWETESGRKLWAKLSAELERRALEDYGNEAYFEGRHYWEFTEGYQNGERVPFQALLVGAYEGELVFLDFERGRAVIGRGAVVDYFEKAYIDSLAD